MSEEIAATTRLNVFLQLLEQRRLKQYEKKSVYGIYLQCTKNHYGNDYPGRMFDQHLEELAVLSLPGMPV
jgi:hypothetical protein